VSAPPVSASSVFVPSVVSPAAGSSPAAARRRPEGLSVVDTGSDIAAGTGTSAARATLPVLFQHGLGGDAAQVAEVFPDGAARRLTVECRGHGGSAFGTERPFSFALFEADLLAALDAAGVGRFVAGGISMGAGLALRLAVRHPDRVAGLVLVRPAWAFAASPANMAPFLEVADLVRRHGAAGRDLFLASPTGRRLGEEAPDNLASLAGFFTRPQAADFAEVMAGIAADGLGVTRAEAARLAVPTLVVGNAVDAVHPLALAEELAAAIRGAGLLTVTAKARDRAAHAAEVRAAIAGFLAGAAFAASRPPAASRNRGAASPPPAG